MAFVEYGLDEEYIWCDASMNEVQTFKYYGWQELGFIDIDLGEVKGKNKGYGIYRTHGMTRRPGPLCL